MSAILRKELRGYLTSWAGYAYLAVFLLLSGFVFTTGNLLSHDADIRSYFASMSTILVFLIPILTMRIFSEERKLRTLPLLFAMPISLGDIVLGKFLATLAVFCIGLAPTLLHPLILAWYGSVQGAAIAGNYVGLLLLVSACIAIGMFVSALTENQLIAAMLTYVVLLTFWSLDALSQAGPATGVSSVLGYLSLNRHVREFTYGIFNPADAIYFLSLSFVFLVFSVLVLDARKAT